MKALPQSSLRSLEMALRMSNDKPLGEVRELIAIELEFRGAKEAIFAPFLPLFQPRSDGLIAVIFPGWLLDRLWASLEIRETELYTQSRYALRGLRTEDPTPVVFYRLITAAAAICREHSEDLLPKNAEPGDRDFVTEFAHYLDLHRIVRTALARLPDYYGRIDAEKATALRLMFKDACEFNFESGYRFIEVIFANLEDGAQVIKFVATVSDRPKDRFLAESELADFGERILDKIEGDLKELQSFMGNKNRICTDLGIAGERLAQGLVQLQSFEHYIELSRDGPWGKRVAASHKLIAELVEAQLNGAERVLDAVLPMKAERVYGRVKREVPFLAGYPKSEAVAHARQVLAFIRQVRNAASAGGFATLHTKTHQTLEIMLDAYFTELLGLANGGDPFDQDQLMAFFELVTDLMEALCGEEKGNVGRRRVASSDIMNPSKSVA